MPRLPPCSLPLGANHERLRAKNFDSIRQLRVAHTRPDHFDRALESIFSWTYHAGQETILSSPEPQAVWRILGQANGEVLTKR